MQRVSKSRSVVDRTADIYRSVYAAGRVRIWDVELALERSKSAVMWRSRDSRQKPQSAPLL